MINIYFLFEYNYIVEINCIININNKNYNNNYIDVDNSLRITENLKIISGLTDRQIKIWDINSSTVEYVFVKAHGKAVRVLLFIQHLHDLQHLQKQQQQILISGGEDCYIKIWDLENRQLMKKLKGNNGYVTSLVNLNNGKFASGSYDWNICIWDINEYTCLNTLTGHTKDINCLIFLNKEYNNISIQ